MKRTELKRGTKGLTRKPSAHKLDYEAELDAITPALRLRARNRCEACRTPLGLDEGERHHRIRRGQGGTNTLDCLVLLCRRCHGWIHRHVSIAKSCGYLVPSWGDLDQPLWPRTLVEAMGR